MEVVDKVLAAHDRHYDLDAIQGVVSGVLDRLLLARRFARLGLERPSMFKDPARFGAQHKD